MTCISLSVPRPTGRHSHRDRECLLESVRAAAFSAARRDMDLPFGVRLKLLYRLERPCSPCSACQLGPPQARAVESGVEPVPHFTTDGDHTCFDAPS